MTKECPEKVTHHDLNIEAIVEAMENAEIVEDYEGNKIKSLFIGTVFSLMPSGKYYQPFACSNVDSCPVCEGKGEVINPNYDSTLFIDSHIKIQKIVNEMKNYSYYGEWPEDKKNLISKVREVEALTRPKIACPRCDGLGSAEARDDEVWRETLEEDLYKHDLCLESGEGDPCDLFVTQLVEEEDPEDDE